MLFCSCSARCNHRNREVIRHFSKRFISVSGLYAIMIHAGEKYFSGTTLLSFFGPGKQFFICFYTASIQIAPPAFFSLFGIYRQHTYLRTEVLSYFINQFGTANCRRIDRNLICTGIQQTVYITQFVDTATYRKRNTNIGSNTLHQLCKCLATFKTGCYIQKNQFISTLLTIRTRQFHRIARLTQIDEIGSFHCLSVFDIETGNNSFR